METAPIIRPATSADAQALADILNHSIEHTNAIWLSEPVDAAERTQWMAQRRVLVAELAGEVAGFAGIGQWKGSCGYRYTAEDSIYIRDGFHGRGIASALFGALIEAAPAQGYRVIVANIEAGNAASIALHEKFGFTKVGLMPGVGFKNDTFLDLAVYQLTLPVD
ncbi:N-acetyltransferase family protein [Staphylococcus chromogenes]|nr:N-acetyltransferase family protein [Staphylococcus chromogenes]